VSDAQATRWIIIAMVVLAISATISSLTGEERRVPSVTVPIAIFTVGLLLSLFREVNAQIAGAFAILLVITTALTGATPLWDALTRATTPREEA